MLQITKTIPIALSLVTMFGILVHDMHIDRAATVAIALPAAMAAGGAAAMLASSDHTHVERASFGRGTTASSLPNAQPPRDDMRKYVQNKKLNFISGDQNYIWPSV